MLFSTIGCYEHFNQARILTDAVFGVQVQWSPALAAIPKGMVQSGSQQLLWCVFGTPNYVMPDVVSDRWPA
jgi:hypothetical protein